MGIDLLRNCRDDQERIRVLAIKAVVATALREWGIENMLRHPVQKISSVKDDAIEITMLDTGDVYRFTMEKIR